jgi:hypothetical protein
MLPSSGKAAFCGCIYARLRMSEVFVRTQVYLHYAMQPKSYEGMIKLFDNAVLIFDKFLPTVRDVMHKLLCLANTNGVVRT